MKKLLSTLIVSLVLLPISSKADEAWYSRNVADFVAKGYINEGTFVPGEDALRAEFVDLTLRLLGGEVHTPLGEPVFDDVDLLSPFFTVFQEGARGGWVQGLGSCSGTHPCMAAPLRTVNRAEAAALLVRAFRIRNGRSTPAFEDNLPGEWYTDYVDVAASRCILQGDDGTDTVRPGDFMNRAEMLAMLRRSIGNFSYPDCAVSELPELPQAPSDFTLVQPEVNLEEAMSSASAAAAMSSSIAAASSSSTAAALASGSSSSSASSASSGSRSSSSLSSLSSFSSSSSSLPPIAIPASADPGYADLLQRLQQYVSQMASLITRARVAEGGTAAPLLTQVQSQMDLMNQFSPYVVVARNRRLDATENSAVQLLQRRIESGFGN